MSFPNWPPPGFPLVHGDYDLNAEWTIHLPEQFARRVEDGSLVLWRPGLTIWMIDWDNDNDQTRAQRLEWIRDEASPARFDQRESTAHGVTRFSYRLRDENDDGPVKSLSGYVIADHGHLQLSIYFDDVTDQAKAQKLIDSVSIRRKT